MEKLCFRFPALLCLLAIFAQACMFFPSSGGKKEILNPHGRAESCNVCHSPDDDGGYSAGNLLFDLNSTCTNCHKKGRADHAVGLVPPINSYDLPLDEDGRINCAITCHNMHPGEDMPFSGFVREVDGELCLSCHEQ